MRARPGGRPQRGVKFKLGVTDWTLKLAGQPEAVLMAGELGFDCLQVSVGRIPRDGKLVLSDKTLQQTYLAESKRHKCPIARCTSTSCTSTV